MRWCVVVLLFWAVPAAAVTCEDVDFSGNSFTACTVDAASENLRLFHKDDGGNVIGSFRAIEDLPKVTSLPFAMNAGMYHEDRSPVGHYREDGVDTMRVITNAGPGNFGLLPNGVFSSMTALPTFTRLWLMSQMRRLAEMRHNQGRCW